MIFFLVTQARLLEISLSGEDNVLKICSTQPKMAAAPDPREHLTTICGLRGAGGANGGEGCL